MLRNNLDQLKKSTDENSTTTSNSVTTTSSPNMGNITLTELAAFCADVYNDLNDTKNLPELPQGWNRSIHTNIFQGGFTGLVILKIWVTVITSLLPIAVQSPHL